MVPRLGLCHNHGVIVRRRDLPATETAADQSATDAENLAVKPALAQLAWGLPAMRFEYAEANRLRRMVWSDKH